MASVARVCPRLRKVVGVMQERQKLLVIDDDERLGSLIRRILAPEYDVRVLESARDALNAIGSGERFDLVLCDLMLPIMTGMDFYERLVVVAPELVDRVIFVTGGAYTPGAAAFLERLSIRHMAKPFSAVELRRVVREHMARLVGESR